MTNRQEVAKKLRETARTFDKEYPNGAKDWLDENAAFNTVDEIICTDNNIPYAPFFSRLADLIDPTCKPIEAGYNIVCSECEADIYDDDLYCPHCGARVVRDEA